MTYIVTNGAKVHPDLPATYIVSLDGPGKVHISLTGAGAHGHLKRNIKRAPRYDIFAVCALNP